ncbi:MAG TPA: DeoR family transcriptional regulator [Actinoplanes sp.]|nr:DeoR family transcriptional regulator [Actinoplanes sp.]
MPAPPRQAAIRDRIWATGGLRVSEPACEGGVSDLTIRRDLESPADPGLPADVLITDDGLDEGARALLVEQVPELMVVSAQ